jgi:hypothetical protein
MDRHDFLTGVHSNLRPRSYVEVGVYDGQGLARSRTRTIGVDPDIHINVELSCDLKLVKATSDDFYARDDALSHFAEGVADLTFIDGMHLFEFAFRDFMNAERTSTPTSAIVLDDMLPRASAEAARKRHTSAWTGDVFRLIHVLDRYRPDLTVIPMDTGPTGVLLVLGLDPANTVLKDHYDEIVAEYITDDPQVLSDDIVHRSNAADPDKVLASPVWKDLVAARDAGEGAPASVQELRELRGTATYVSNPPDPGVWPRPRPAPKPAQVAAAVPFARRVRRAVKRRLRAKR